MSFQTLLLEFFISIGTGCLIFFVCVYSTTEPTAPSGTVEPKEMTVIVIHFILYHTVIFRKIFIKPYNLSIFKLGILAIQIGIYYIGFVIISAVDYYQYKGLIWYTIKGKIILIAIFGVWISVSSFWVKFMI